MEAEAPLIAHLDGVALRDLTGVINNSHEVLGQGGFGRVAAVDIAGCQPLCVKTILDEDLMEDTLQEAQHMFALRDVSGIPRILGISESPLALLMTRHGRYTLKDVALGRAEGLEVSTVQVFQGLALLMDILQDIHSHGLVHNDIKPDNVIIELDEDGQVKVTLLDLGCMSAVGEKPYEDEDNETASNTDFMLQSGYMQRDIERQ